MTAHIVRKTQPQWMAPMLATLCEHRFFEANWIYERKLDGMRCILYKKGKNIIIWSRNKVQQNNVFPELVTALKKYSNDFILDAEVVAFTGKNTSFSKLSNRMHVNKPDLKLIKKVPITAYVFDILYLNGYDLTQLPLLTRKQVLKEHFRFVKPLQYLPHRVKNGAAYYEHARQANWEGLIAKQADAIYVHKRAKTWLKFKCIKGQELVIAGYTLPQGNRNKFGALLLGYYKNRKLIYASKVGTGFDENNLQDIYAKMQPLRIAKNPFTKFRGSARGAIWLQPKLVAELAFTEWTKDGSLRHPSFLGLRTDKRAIDVVRE